MNKKAYEETSNTGELIQFLRLQRGITQEQLGELIDASFKTISKWENNYSFPELYHQRKLCEVFDITLEELHSGKINLAKRRQNRRNTIILKAAIVFLFLCPIIITFLICCFNDLRFANVYYLEVSDSSFTKCDISGMIVKQADDYIIYIGNIDLLEYDYNKLDLLSIDFYYNDLVIYHTNKISNITFKTEKNINPNDITIKIEISDFEKKKIVYENTLSILVSPLLHNNIEEAQVMDFNDGDIEKALLDMGFERKEDYLDKKKQFNETRYYVASKKLIIHDISNSNSLDVVFFMNIGSFDVYIENNKFPVEMYSYNVDDGLLSCNVGKCYSVKEVLKNLEPYITLRNKEIDSLKKRLPN